MLLGAIISSPFVRGQQNESSVNTENTRPNYIPAPQTWGFIRYGATPVNYYTGTAQVDVPIYTYNDNDFTLNVSAGYASSGFQPQRQTGILGLNWFLNCGGSITREIRGLADDEYVVDNGAGCMLLTSNYDEARVFDLTAVSRQNEQSAWSVNGREVDADIFHFNFMGHSGTFHINGQRKICVYNTNGNHGTYEIIPQLKPNQELLSITVRTGDGYTYLFGGDDPSVERSIRGSYTSPGNYYIRLSDRHPVVTWLLREVTAPNGRKITFTYDSVQNLLSYLARGSNNPFYVVSFAMGRNKVPSTPDGRMHYRKASVIRTSYLTGITVSNGSVTDRALKIDFKYSLKAFRDAADVNNNDSDYAKADANIAQYLKQLDEIIVTSGTGVLRRCNFSYREKTLNNNRLILEKIDVSGVGAYIMKYYEPTRYPDLSTSAVDFWGYYNGRDDNLFSQIAPTDVNRLNMEEQITADYRNPNWKFGVAGCLKRIIYPTKGFTDFEYEPNRAKYMVQRNMYPNLEGEIRDDFVGDYSPTNSADKYLSALNSYLYTFRGNDETGGVRIRKIIDNDGVGNSQIRQFDYERGTVMTFPRFWSYSVWGMNELNPYINIPGNTFDQTHIGYEVVREKYADGSYVEYRYNDYRSHPDEYDGQHRRTNTSFNIPPVADSTFLNNISRMPNSHHYQRGKLNRKTFYDKNRNKVRCEYMVYADHDVGRNYTAYVVGSGAYYYSVKKFTGDYRLTEKRATDYFGQDSISTTTRYVYNDLGQIRSTIERDAEGVVRESHVEYCHETLGQSDTEHHVLDYPSLTYTTVTARYLRKIATATKYDYVKIGDMIKPAKVSQAVMAEPKTWPFLSQLFPSLTYVDKVLYEAYDTQGNPVQVRDAAGVVTSYLWGYQGRYPVAKVVGATYARIKAALALADDAPVSAALTSAQASALRAIEGAFVDTYVYKPQVGMTEHTDPAGKTYRFSYDSYGRLVGTDDPLGVVQQYEYHL